MAVAGGAEAARYPGAGKLTEGELIERNRLAREVALSVMDVAGSLPEFRELHKSDTSMTTDLWYERYCLGTSQVVQQALNACGVETTLAFGRFEDLRHAWLEFEDGTILDPTARQMGIEEEAAIITPTDPRYRHYRMRGCWKEGDSEVPPR